VYADFACPFCAVAHARIQEVGGLTVVFRHFALKSKHPRAPALAAAAEAAASQGAFWAFHDLLYADQGRQADPHLWDKAQQLGLDVDRFEHDRRSEETLARVKRDVRAALKAGAVATPTLFMQGERQDGPPSTARLQSVRNDEKQEGARHPKGRPGKDNFI
jgi:protein-disulfide isomerase